MPRCKMQFATRLIAFINVLCAAPEFFSFRGFRAASFLISLQS